MGHSAGPRIQRVHNSPEKRSVSFLLGSGAVFCYLLTKRTPWGVSDLRRCWDMAHAESITELQRQLEDLRREFQAHKEELQREEARKLRTALVAAGGVILTLAGFVWVEIIWPVIKAGIDAK